jgi:hypothetical protein
MRHGPHRLGGVIIRSYAVDCEHFFTVRRIVNLLPPLAGFS